VKKSLARVPLLVPFLCVAACTTPSDPSASLASAAVVAVEEGAIARDAPPSKGRRKLDRLAAQKAEQDADPAQSVRQDASIASEIAAIFQRGQASWYGPGFDGKRTASGERFQPQAMTAAHRSLPFGTRVRVTHVSTGRSVVVRINDRGPFHGGRIIDLAAGPARMLGLTSVGSAYVSLHRID
jgi:rare lipoprotein A